MTATPTVELLCLTQRAPLLVQGELTHPDSDMWIFTANETIAMDVLDCNAIVNPNDGSPMMTLHIVKQSDETLELHTISTHPREKRSYPRLFSMINLYVHPVKNEQSMTEWMQDSSDQTFDGWIHPEPFMNFSVNGVAFSWTAEVPTNTRLLVAINVDDSDTYHRGIARVVRCSKQESDHWQIALYFEQLSDNAIQHLVALTMRLQDSML